MMKKINNKGTTLMEVVISIALISVVLVFMIRLLVDLNNTNSNNDYAKDNQINRAEIIKIIENDLNKKEIIGITDKSSNDQLMIEFSFSDNTSSIITATDNNLIYVNASDEKRQWTMNDATIYVDEANVSYMSDMKDKGESFYSLEIDIEIHTNNDNNTQDKNNCLDDIIITHVGKTINYDGQLNGNIIECLGNDC